jgi:hypothetical protein
MRGEATEVQVIQRKLIASAAVVAAELDQEAVLLNVETGLYFGLDEVGSEIWRCIERGTTREEIRQHLLTEFEVSADEVEADLTAFLDELLTHGLILVEET